MLLVCVRITALGLAALVGLSVGSTLPAWQLDRWNEPENHAEADVLDASDPLGMYGGCGSLLPGVLAEMRASCSWLAIINLLLMAGALMLAACGWPPLWLNPIKSELIAFLVVTLFQRWIWYPLGTLLIGMLAGGALSLRRQWFKSR